MTLRMIGVEESSINVTPAEIQERLTEFLRRETGEKLVLTEPRSLAGGASRAAWAFDVESTNTEIAGRYVLRLDLGGEIYDTALSRAEEFCVIDAAHGSGVLVPRVFWHSSDPDVLERDFLVMERIDGETIGRKIVARPDLEKCRAKLPAKMGRELARIHAIDPKPLDFLMRPASGESPATAALERARKELDRVRGSHAALEIGLAWLLENAPSCGSPVVVHGDFRLGNVVVDETGLRAILDWEFSSIGDPHEDLAWPFVRDWRFGVDQNRFAGITDGEDFLESYEAESGRSVDRNALSYWEIVGNFRWALGCLTQARRHLSGESRSVELASLGRRSAEMALEMFERIAEFEM